MATTIRSADGTLEAQLSEEPAGAMCALELSGTISVAAGCSLLDALWEQPAYLDARGGLWDVGNCELPDFETLRAVANYVRHEKRGRGPGHTVFVSPDFALSTLARALSGFSRIARLSFSFAADTESARSWLSARLAD